MHFSPLAGYSVQNQVKSESLGGDQIFEKLIFFNIFFSITASAEGNRKKGLIKIQVFAIILSVVLFQSLISSLTGQL